MTHELKGQVNKISILSRYCWKFVRVHVNVHVLHCNYYYSYIHPHVTQYPNRIWYIKYQFLFSGDALSHRSTHSKKSLKNASTCRQCLFSYQLS